MTEIKETSDELIENDQTDTISAESPDLQEPEEVRTGANQKPKSKRPTKKFDIDHYTKKATVYINILKRIPFVLIGDRIKAKKENYQNLQKQLNQARIPISHEMYISNAIFYSIIAGIVGALVGLFLTYTVIVLVGLPDQLTNITFSPRMAALLEYKEIFLSFFITIVFMLGMGGVVYALFMIFPGFQASERKSKIDMQLPYAVTFMYALSKGGMNIIDIFRAIASAEDTYGEVSKEVDSIIRDMDYFGHDLRTALSSASEITPSDRFQDLIYNLLTVIDSGGNIPNYFRDKSEQYLIKAEVDQKGFLETLGLLAESYVTAFVAGPLFIIIMGVMMAVMGSGTTTMVSAIIYAVLPVGSLMFVVMISIITPTEMGEPKLLPTNETLDHGIPDVPKNLEQTYDENDDLIDESEEKVRERNCFEGFIKSKKSLALRNILNNPLAPMYQNPMATLAVTIPLALLVIFIPLFMNMNVARNPLLLIDFIDDKLVLALFIVMVPLSIFHELKARRKRKLENSFPDFLKKLASTNETGMTLRDAIRLMAKSDTDSLSKEIKKIWHDIFWGLEINDGLIRFANRLRTQVVTRSLSLITKANESSGDIGEVLMVAARDASSEQGMKRERGMSMMIYIVIIYISFMVFVGVIYVISTTFLTEMAEAGQQMASSGSTAGGFLGNFDLEYYTRLFKHASILQGLSSGLMAGAMGEGSVLSGLKHSTIMIAIGYTIFTLFI
ncbi:type II secretion system F family protein [uncultured Methanolobus sp.]|uniref:type II secretion system F family protein n=1 Tax=uncultured Methanolobus sp. TaxID=218300 RepID=UPI0029C98D3E|nr:type II secretion system F family protein [uncultured Methanolobus sp.]